MPKISVLVPLWNNQREFQIEMLESVMNQTYENWELCLADGSDEAHAYMGKSAANTWRNPGQGSLSETGKNSGISGNTNACLGMATGEFIGLLDQDDILHPSVLYEYVKAINEQGADYLYCDETTFKSGNIDHMLTMHFKPDYSRIISGQIIISAISVYLPGNFWTAVNCSVRNSTEARIMI